MVKFTVPLSDILGSAYYRYELVSSSYNPNIDSNITIICTCKNVLGNPVSNKTLELFQNNASVGTATTNANGIATWTITCSNWGIQHFNVENKSIDVRVRGFKTTTPHTYYTLYEYEDRVGLRVHINSNINFPNAITVINSNVIPHEFAPRYPIMIVCANGTTTSTNTAIGVRESNNGHTELIVKSLTGSTISAQAYAYLEWDKKY